MAKEGSIAAPAAPTQPATPAAPAAQAAAPAKAAKPAAAPARQSSIPQRTAKPKLTAKKALGLEETPRKMAEAVTKSAREKIRGAEPTVDLRVDVPAEPAAPAQPAPAAPAAEPAAPAAPAQPAAPAKFKVGENEYTQEELEALVKKGEQPAAVPAAPAAPAAPEEEAPAAPQLTAEEIAQREAQFLADTTEQLDAPLTEQEMETILAGGKEAVTAMQAIRKRDMATAVLHARKGIAAGLNPVMEQVFAALKPLVANHEALQRYTVEQEFLATHKDFAPHITTARSIAEQLLKQYPQDVAKMSRQQFINEVARQTDVYLTNEHKRWFPQGGGNWRGHGASAAPAVPAAPSPAAPAAPVVAAPAAPAPAPARVVRAPAANAPTGVPATGAVPWHKSVAASMRG